MTLQEYEVVRLRRPLPDCSLPVGATGAVVMVHDGGKAYEVEFCDESGTTIALLTLGEDDLEKMPNSAGHPLKGK